MRSLDRREVGLFALALLATVLSVGGCDDDGIRPEAPEEPMAVRMEVVGVGWTSPTGRALRDSVVATVEDTTGAPLSGVATTWRVTAGGGRIEPAEALTDASGAVKVRWTLGLEPGLNRAVVTATLGRQAVAVDTVTATGSDHPLYSVAFLGEFGGVDLNEWGQVAGTRDHADGERRAVLWDDGEIVELRTLGGSESAAAALNDLGHVAGRAQTESGYWNGALWREGQIVDLGGIGDLGRVTGINDQDVVVGTDWGPHRAFLWRDGERSWLAGMPDTTPSEAVAVNDSGQVAGTSGAFGPFFWDAGEIVQVGDTLGLWVYEPVAMNDHGQVAGWLLGLYDRSFVWDPPGSGASAASSAGSTRLGAVVAAVSGEPRNPGGGRWRRVYDINNHGETVSMAEIAVFHGDAVVSVDEGFRVLDFFLEDHAWDINGVRSINDRGQILAGGHNSETGQEGSVLLTPLR